MYSMKKLALGSRVLSTSQRVYGVGRSYRFEIQGLRFSFFGLRVYGFRFGVFEFRVSGLGLGGQGLSGLEVVHRTVWRLGRVPVQTHAMRTVPEEIEWVRRGECKRLLSSSVNLDQPFLEFLGLK